jgi:hypothetical protein
MAAMMADRLAAMSAWMSAAVWDFLKAELREPNSVAEKGILTAEARAARKVLWRAETMDAQWADGTDGRSVASTVSRWAAVKG